MCFFRPDPGYNVKRLAVVYLQGLPWILLYMVVAWWVTKLKVMSTVRSPSRQDWGITSHFGLFVHLFNHRPRPHWCTIPSMARQNNGTQRISKCCGWSENLNRGGPRQQGQRSNTLNHRLSPTLMTLWIANVRESLHGSESGASVRWSSLPYSAHDRIYGSKLSSLMATITWLLQRRDCTERDWKRSEWT